MDKFTAKFRLGTLTAGFILIFTLAAMCIVLFVGEFYIRGKVINHYLEKYLDCVHSDFVDSTAEMTRQLDALSLSVTTDKNIYRTVSNTALSPDEKSELLCTQLRGFLSEMNMIQSLAFVTEDGRVYSSDGGEGAFRVPDAKALSDSKTNSIVCLNKIERDKSGTPYVVFTKRMRNYNSGVSIGRLFFYVKESALNQAFSGQSAENAEVFVAADGLIIAHRDASRVGSYFYLPDSRGKKAFFAYDDKYMIDIHDFSNTDPLKWTMVSIIEKDAVYAQIRSYIYTLRILIILLILFCGAAALAVARRLAAPVKTLEKKIRAFGHGESVVFNLSDKNEIIALSESFHKMTDEIAELIRKNNEEKEKQRIAELHALQSQIKPHFLYNTLDVIAWMAKIKEQPEIEDMLHSLAQFFRISLHGGDNFITVGEELSHAENYIKIEQQRFPGFFEAEWEISPQILPCRTPKIILQPIIENAIKHGFRNRRGMNNTIRIAGFEMNGDIYFEIRDNGCGMERDPLSGDGAEQRGYGIYNVQQRLLLEYGSGYGLSYDTQPNVGTVVTVRIKRQKMNIKGDNEYEA